MAVSTEPTSAGAVSMRDLLEAGVHFGHQTRRWNPKMRRFIFAERGGIYIIDLTQTAERLDEARLFLRNVAERGGTVLFVGTKKQAQDAVENEAKRVDMPYVNHRWLGGLLTNWRTMADRIDRLHEMRRLRDEGQLELLPAKERIAMAGELEKLEANLGGVADMRRQPDAVVILDLKKEALAVREARRLGVPVVALVDTNCDPDEADYVIPGNDDAIRSCNLIVHALAEAVNDGKQKVSAQELQQQAEEAPAAAEESAPEDDVEDVSRRRDDPAGDRGRVRSGADRRGPGQGRRGRDEAVGRRTRRSDARKRGGGLMAAEISAQLVRELRERTGVGMMDCKRALQETNGDMEAAVVLLREKGMAQAAKRADRATTEGLVGYRLADDQSRGTMVAVGCETEPVAKSDEFQAFGKKVLDLVEAEGIEAPSQLEEERVELSAKLGENIAVAGAARFEAVDGGTIAAYAHPPANKLGVLVHVRGGDDDLGRKLAMHIAASSPQWVAREDVPEESIATEREIFANTDEVQSKPEQAREKIVEGMLNKRFFGANVLAEQEWIHDGSQTVGKVLADAGAEVLEFQRFSLAG